MPSTGMTNGVTAQFRPLLKAGQVGFSNGTFLMLMKVFLLSGWKWVLVLVLAM
jgi:hypothetical protein